MKRATDTRLLVESLSDSALIDFEACLESRVRHGTATLTDFGRLAQARKEIAGRRLNG